MRANTISEGIVRASLNAFAVLGMVLMSVGVSHGAAISWTNASNGNWSDPANWSSNTVPDTSDTVSITLDGTYTVTLDVDATVTRIKVGASSGTQTLTATGRTFTFNGESVIESSGVLSFTSGTITGGGKLVNHGTLQVDNSMVNFDLDNHGTMEIRGEEVILNGSLITHPGSSVQIIGNSALILSNGFTNLGTIDVGTVSNILHPSQSVAPLLHVVEGELINGPEGTIVLGRSGRLAAQVNNQGTLNIADFAAMIANGFVAADLFRLGAVVETAAHTNSGTINVDANGGLKVLQRGDDATFSNTGLITLDGTLEFDGGLFDLGGATLDGVGTLVLTNASLELGDGGALGDKIRTSFFDATIDLGKDISISEPLEIKRSVVNASGVVTNTSTLQVESSTLNLDLDNQGIIEIKGEEVILDH